MSSKVTMYGAARAKQSAKAQVRYIIMTKLFIYGQPYKLTDICLYFVNLDCSVLPLQISLMLSILEL